jgi:hypothetical protein
VVYIGIPENARNSPAVKYAAEMVGIGHWKYKLQMAFGDVSQQKVQEMSKTLLKELEGVEEYLTSLEEQRMFSDFEKFLKDLRDVSEQKAEELRQRLLE